MKLIKEFFSAITSLGSLPAMGLFGIFFLLTNFNIFLKLFVGIALSFVIITVIRLNFYKHRPHKKIKPKNVLGIIAKSSFPSMHSANSTIFAIVVGLSTNMTLLVFFIVMALIIIFSRWFLRKHYPIDLLAGTVLGVLVALFVNFVF